MACRQLRYYNDEILRKKCKEVITVNDSIRGLLNDMTVTMYATEAGAGLAANQIGILKRLVVVDIGKGLIKLVNPTITARSGIQKCVEGCLSIPNRMGITVRPQKVTVQALNEYGKAITVTGVNELAKCLCHEIDHLDGILFVDRVIEFI